MINKKYYTKITEIYIDDQGIVIVKFNDKEVEFDEAEAKDQVEIVSMLVKKKKSPILVDGRSSTLTPTQEAKKIIIDFPYKLSEAIIVNQLHQRITSNFFLKLSWKKFKHPVKVFTSYQKAYEWSRSQILNNVQDIVQ